MNTAALNRLIDYLYLSTDFFTNFESFDKDMMTCLTEVYKNRIESEKDEFRNCGIIAEQIKILIKETESCKKLTLLESIKNHR